MNTINRGNYNEMIVLAPDMMVQVWTGSKYEIEFHSPPQDDPTKRCPDLAKAKRILGWQLKVSLVGGLKRTIEWMCQPLSNASG